MISLFSPCSIIYWNICNLNDFLVQLLDVPYIYLKTKTSYWPRFNFILMKIFYIYLELMANYDSFTVDILNYLQPAIFSCLLCFIFTVENVCVGSWNVFIHAPESWPYSHFCSVLHFVPRRLSGRHLHSNNHVDLVRVLISYIFLHVA